MQIPVPGTTLAAMTEEYKIMEYTQQILSDKLRLDEQYAKDLGHLRDSMKARYKEGPISPLLDPLVQLFDQEILKRKATCQSVADCLTPLPHPSPDQPLESGEIPSSMYKTLKKPYDEVKMRHDAACSKESVAELQSWYQGLEKIGEEDCKYEIPIVDQQYRRAVVDQHETLSPIESWHESRIPVVIEEHQTNMEYLKERLQDVIREEIRLCSEIVQDCSAAIYSINRFSSTTSIASKHDEIIKEREHPYLKAFVYHRFWLDGKGSTVPIFGISREKQLEVLLSILKPDKPLLKNLLPLKHLESMAHVERGGIAYSPAYSPKNTATWALLTCAPLIPVDKGLIEQHKNGVPRRKIASLLPKDLASQQILALFMNRRSENWFHLRDLSIILCHHQGAETIVKEIFRKWDLERSCPFPNGTARGVHIRRGEMFLSEAPVP